jgi:hypothetical protein
METINKIISRSEVGKGSPGIIYFGLDPYGARALSIRLGVRRKDKC